MKNVKVILIKGDSIFKGEGQIKSHREQSLFGSLFFSKNVESAIESAEMFCESIDFVEHKKSEFLDFEKSDEIEDVYKVIDFKGLYAIKNFDEKAAVICVDTFMIHEDEENEEDNECIENYWMTLSDDYLVKIENGVIHESNKPMMFH